MQKLRMDGNRLSGCLPQAVTAMTSMNSLVASENQLRGAIPDAIGSLLFLETLRIDQNDMAGSIPLACGRLFISTLNVWDNAFSGPALIDQWTQGVFSLTLDAARNRLTGSLPEGILHMMTLFSGTLDLAENRLTGTLSGFGTAAWSRIRLENNMLAGTIPFGFTVSGAVGIQKNKLIGSLPPDAISDTTTELICSGNRLEGTLPQVYRRSRTTGERNTLKFLDVSGMLGSASRLRGPLPGTLARARDLSLLLAHNQELQGNIPALSGTLNMLVLHRNRLKAMPGRLLLSTKEGYYSVILLHENLLSCDLPRLRTCGAMISIAALGNHLSYPTDGSFPTWVSPVEKEGLFWISKTEGRMFGLKLIIALSLFGCAVRMQFTSKLAWEAVSRWRTAIGPSGVFAQAICCQLSEMLGMALWAVTFLAILLNWDLYHCPRALALASACLRENTGVRVIAVLTWATQLLRLRTGRHDKSRRQDLERGEHFCKRIWCKRIQLIAWVPLTLSLSAIAVVDQMNRSVPDIFQVGASATRAISVSIASAQGLILGYLVPWLIDRLAPDVQALQVRKLKKVVMVGL